MTVRGLVCSGDSRRASDQQVIHSVKRDVGTRRISLREAAWLEIKKHDGRSSNRRQRSKREVGIVVNIQVEM